MKHIYILALIVLSFIPMVFADNPVETLFYQLERLEFGENYEKYYLGIDFVIYLLIFGSALRAVAKERFGAGLVFGLTIAFSFAMIMFEMRSDFMIGDFYLLAVLVLVAIFIGFVYSHLKGQFGDGHKWTWLSVGYIAIYAVVKASFPRIWMDLGYDYPWISLLLQIFLVIALVIVGKVIFQLFSKN